MSLKIANTRITGFRWASVIMLGCFMTAAPVAKAADLIITSPTSFSSLDGSASDSDGTVNGVLVVDNLYITNGGSITFNDPTSPGNASAGSVNIVVNGDMTMDPGTAITAENRVSGGNGGDITITVANSMYLGPTSGVTVGALISTRKTSGSGDTGHSGNITISAPFFFCDAGSVVTAGRVTGTDRGPAGAIVIQSILITIDGEISSRSGMSGTGAKQPPGGGPISVIGSLAVAIDSTGLVSSRGNDPGADLVHIEAPLVYIGGLVESAGAGHAIPNNPVNHLGPTYRSDKPANSTGGIEVWSDYLTIDNLNASGVLNADIGTSGGSAGRGWIDLYANTHMEVFGAASGTFAVHSNGGLSQTNDDGGIVTVKCVSGDVTASGLVFQADAVNAGGKGGSITVGASTDLFFDTAQLFARGDFNPTGGYGYGGQIDVRAFNGSITWTNGSGDVRPTGSSVPVSHLGVIQMTYSVLLDTTNTTFPSNGTATTPATPVQASGGSPSLPAYVVLPIL